MEHGTGLKGARALAKAKVYQKPKPARPEWNDDLTDLSRQQSSTAELAEKKLERTSKHLDQAKTDLYFKAKVDSLDKRQRELEAREARLKIEQDEARLLTTTAIQKQQQLNKLYENLEKNLHESTTREQALKRREEGQKETIETLRIQELALSEALQQERHRILEEAQASVVNQELREAMEAREAALTFKEKQMALLGERLAMQEQHLGTVERQLEEQTREWLLQNERWKHVHEEEVARWAQESENEAKQMTQARENLSLEKNQLRDRIAEADAGIVERQSQVDQQLLGLANREIELVRREASLSLQAEDVMAREARLLSFRDSVCQNQQDEAARLAKLSADLHARERRLQIFAADAEAQAELNAKRQLVLQAREPHNLNQN
ncbi:Aste57867_718 [Aphanomyces stellatus]|uniref:Aste57867_718 protein n=1 Tax=Aphanomyces stellatus TaxID=120398 RepID=A0A485K6K4_9STRA|nr:hypothetical protein As57867_000717 [Aphanomyces stellatus]VFT77942.1 Aste57867_718 [Aphanomyces stellatus]